MYKKYFKRLLDVVMSFFGIWVLSGVMLIVALLVKIKLGSPVIFTQERPGKDEKIFKMYKFRTMTDKRDENGELLPATDRLTVFGRLLRSTSLDELPELFNVLLGDMSLVGPRPLLVAYLARYNKYQAKRHNVRPGITGFAQVNGRNAISWEEKFDFDVQYAENITFLGDVSILAKTVVKVFKRSDINASETVPMKEFMGSEENVDV